MIRILCRSVAPIMVAGLISQIGIGAAQAGKAPFPPSSNQAGQQHDVVEWCDTGEAMASVVNAHAAEGGAAASALWDELVEQGICHWVPPQLPATATLLEELHAAYVMTVDPLRGGGERQAIVEVWLAVVDGVADHPVYIMRADWASEPI